MKTYFGYIRVSTAKQGTHGVSLTEQKAAIERYAERNGLSIGEWFEERESAAKRGRPVFGRMLRLLRKGAANGVIVHKIDRSARNLKDWADLGEMIDAGIEAHFAADALDLSSRGGRLSADIQAVVAADYIRNLREETKKGFYGRLKQGLYPLGAPIGYLDQGGGKAKVRDPNTAPFIEQAFALYATGTYTLHALRGELVRRGFKRRNGGRLHVSSLSHLLNNPFYAGVIRIKKTNETFRGVHEPLVSAALFARVQEVLKGKLVARHVTHDFTYRKLFKCGICDRTLIGERQKGHVYYRCHARGCPATSIREDAIEKAIRGLYRRIALTSEEVSDARAYLAERAEGRASIADAEIALSLALANAKGRLDRLTDAFIDGLLPKTAFEGRRVSLAVDIDRLEAQRADAAEHLARKRATIMRALELAENLVLGHEMATTPQKREMLELISSNRTLCGKALAFTLHIPFERLENRASFQSGAPTRKIPRTKEICPDGQKAWLRRLVDSMFEDDEPNRRTPTTFLDSNKSECLRDVNGKQAA